MLRILLIVGGFVPVIAGLGYGAFIEGSKAVWPIIAGLCFLWLISTKWKSWIVKQIDKSGDRKLTPTFEEFGNALLESSRKDGHELELTEAFHTTDRTKFTMKLKNGYYFAEFDPAVPGSTPVCAGLGMPSMNKFHGPALVKGLYRAMALIEVLQPKRTAYERLELAVATLGTCLVTGKNSKSYEGEDGYIFDAVSLDGKTICGARRKN